MPIALVSPPSKTPTELAALLTTFWLCYSSNMATGVIAGVAVQRGLKYLSHSKLSGGGDMHPKNA